jgi:glycosyltransferase involved in cell wall biosynthesis
MKISACIVTYNEEKMIEECLQSLHWVDEIIIIDGESSDKTVEIAKKYTSKIYIEENQYNPEINKNKCIDRAINDWVFVIDADERVTNELIYEIKQLELDKNNIIGFNIPMKNFWRDKWLQHGGFYPKKHLRLFNRKYVKYNAVTVHNGMSIHGETADLSNHMLHFAFMDVFECVEKMNKYSEVEANSMMLNPRNGYYWKMFYVPFRYFVKSYILKRGYKDGFEGFAVSILSVITYFMHYLKYIDKLKADSKNRIG